MVDDVIKTTKENLNIKKIKNINDVYKQNILMVNFSDKMKKTDKYIKDFLKHNMYNHKKVLSNTNRGKKIIKSLFKYLIKNPKKFISNDLLRRDTNERAVSDFIAGMTDRYAINLHKMIR